MLSYTFCEIEKVIGICNSIVTMPDYKNLYPVIKFLIYSTNAFVNSHSRKELHSGCNMAVQCFREIEKELINADRFKREIDKNIIIKLITSASSYLRSCYPKHEWNI